MASDVKIGRMESLIMDVINETLTFHVNDKIAKQARITTVRLSNDLSVAKVFFDTTDRKKTNLTLEALNKIQGLLRSNVASKWKGYKVPELRFVIDETIDYAINIENLFKEIKKKENQDK
ncbi:30S ribosome-binding factor RbfA [Ureaplasma canigenitalium]|uniref:30S ribosome-binding factor RbfA n=1 Tax=Ureaplasma canigenitalium TaxID=42092 RepID=UPI0004E136C6|nr:30S ribosome-binding factor RbfA [Ureaplasma canigenitalium]